MGQLLIRQLRDETRAALRRRADAAKTSVEAVARSTLDAIDVASAEERRAIVRRNWALSNAALVAGVEPTPGWELIREDRDAG